MKTICRTHLIVFCVACILKGHCLVDGVMDEVERADPPVTAYHRTCIRVFKLIYISIGICSMAQVEIFVHIGVSGS